MRIIVHKTFTYQKSPRKTANLYPGEYEVGADISLHVAESVLRFGKADTLPEPVVVKPVIVEKVAPENKVVDVVENKATVESKPVRRRSTRAKSKQ